jgi:hypothetical protein
VATTVAWASTDAALRWRGRCSGIGSESDKGGNGSNGGDDTAALGSIGAQRQK